MNTDLSTSAVFISQLTAFYGTKTVLSGVSVDIKKGSMVGIIGPNGAGKSTLIKAVLGFVSCKAQSVLFLAQPFETIRTKISYVAQRAAIDWDFPLTVFDMVLMGCYGRLRWWSSPTESDYKKAYECIEKVGLSHKKDAPISTLSGGQQQRAFVARALMQEAEIFLFDEPFAGVDIATEIALIDIFKQLCAQGKTIIMVHHDIMTATAYFSHLLLLNQTLISYGKAHEVLSRKMLEKTYGAHAVRHFKTLFDRKEGSR